MSDQPKSQIAFDLGDEKLRTAFKRKAEDRGTTMKDVLIAFIEEYVSASEPDTPKARAVLALERMYKRKNLTPTEERLKAGIELLLSQWM